MIGCATPASAGDNSLRRLVGLLWLVGWSVVLYLVAAPWADLGGIVSERLRWLERFVLWSGAVVGYAVAGHLRQIARPATLPAYGRCLRGLLYPPALLTAAGLVALELAGLPDPAGVLLTGFLSYWAGIDAAFSAFPLIAGRLLAENAPTLASTRGSAKIYR